MLTLFRDFRAPAVPILKVAAVVAVCATPIHFANDAFAWTAGYFHLRGTARDTFGGQALRAIDVVDKTNKVTGYVYATGTTFAKDSQLWRELLVQGDLNHVKLQNKLTGQCIGEAADDGVAVIRPCADPSTVWLKVYVRPNQAAYQHVTKRVFPFSDLKVCLGKTEYAPDIGKLMVMGCSDGPAPWMVWETYISG